MTGLRDPYEDHVTAHTARWAGVTVITLMGEDVT
jgi:hypothetical protein